MADDLSIPTDVLVQQIANDQIDLLLLDLHMPGSQDLYGLVSVRDKFPGIPVAVISGIEEPAIVSRALGHGASGYIPKSCTPQEIFDAISALLSIDDDLPWARNQVQRRLRRMIPTQKSDVPGVVFLEIDGLAKPILQKVIREGYMPTLSRWLESGSHVLTGWETDTSSQTSASQAGILHGNNTNIPAIELTIHSIPCIIHRITGDN